MNPGLFFEEDTSMEERRKIVERRRKKNFPRQKKPNLKEEIIVPRTHSTLWTMDMRPLCHEAPEVSDPDALWEEFWTRRTVDMDKAIGWVFRFWRDLAGVKEVDVEAAGFKDVSRWQQGGRRFTEVLLRQMADTVNVLMKRSGWESWERAAKALNDPKFPLVLDPQVPFFLGDKYGFGRSYPAASLAYQRGWIGPELTWDGLVLDAMRLVKMRMVGEEAEIAFEPWIQPWDGMSLLEWVSTQRIRAEWLAQRCNVGKGTVDKWLAGETAPARVHSLVIRIESDGKVSDLMTFIDIRARNAGRTRTGGYWNPKLGRVNFRPVEETWRLRNTPVTRAVIQQVDPKELESVLFG